MNIPRLDLSSFLCPTCGYKLEAAACVTGPEAVQPSVGDISVCFGCGEFLEFEEAGMKKLPEDLSYLGPRNVRAMLVAREAILARKRRNATLANSLREIIGSN